MAKLGLLGSSPHRSSPPQQQQTAVAVAAAVSPEQQEVQQEQQGEAWQGEEVEEQELSAQYGQSPDSDCSEQTGQHLMENFHEGMAGGSYASPDAGVQLQGSPGAADVRGSEGGSTLAAALPQLSRPPPQQQQTSPGPSVEASCEHRHMIESPREAYTLPEHAQAAALLGQPAFDRGLSVGSNSRPPRSPFMSGLLHHSHPPGPQEQQRAAAAAVPSAGSVDGDSGALAAALARMSGLGTVPTVSSEVHWLHGEGQATSSSSNGGSSANFATLPFSVRNAPLLHVIPKYCECRGLGMVGFCRIVIIWSVLHICVGFHLVARPAHPRLCWVSLPNSVPATRRARRWRDAARGCAHTAGAGGPGTRLPAPLHH